MSSVRRGFVFLTVGQGVSMVASYATHLILARILGPGDYGRYGVFLSVISTVALILTAGLPEAISKYVAERPEQASGIFREGLRLQLRLSFAIAFLYALLTPVLGWLFDDASLTKELLVSALCIPSVALYSLITGAFAGQRRFGAQAWTLGAYGTLRCVLSVALAPLYAVWGAIFALVIAPVVVVAATLPSLFVRGASARLDAGALQRFARPVIVFTVLLALMMNLDLFVVKALSPSAELVGYYTAAATIAKVPYFGFSSLGVVLLPTVSAAAVENTHALEVARRAIRWTFLASMAVSAVVAALSDTILSTLYGAAYAQTAWPLALLVVSGTLFTMFFIIAYALNGLGRPEVASRLTAFGVVVELGLAIGCGRLWGAVGVALASCVVAMGALIAISWAAKPCLGVALGPGTLSRVSLSLAGTVAVGSMLPDYGAWSLLLGAPLLFLNLGLLLLVREISLAEVASLLARPVASVRGIPARRATRKPS